MLSYLRISVKSYWLQLENAALKLSWIFLSVRQHRADTGFPERPEKHLFSDFNSSMIWHSIYEDNHTSVTVFKGTDVACL